MTSGHPWKERAWEALRERRPGALARWMWTEVAVAAFRECFFAGIQAAIDHQTQEKRAETRRRKQRQTKET